MDKRSAADELVALYVVSNLATLPVGEMELPHFRHLVARLSALGYDFASVIEAGLARLLGLTAKDIGRAWDRQPLVRIVSTDNWQFHVGFYLLHYAEVLSESDRTYLEMILSRKSIMGNDMLDLELVFRRAFEASRNINWGERMEEFRSPAGDAARGEQLDLDV